MKLRALLMGLLMCIGTSAHAASITLDEATLTGTNPLTDISGITITYIENGGGGGLNGTTYGTPVLTLGVGDEVQIDFSALSGLMSSSILVYDLDTPLVAPPALEEITVAGGSTVSQVGVDFDFPNLDAVTGTPNSEVAIPMMPDANGIITLTSSGGGGLFAFDVQYMVPEPSAGLLALLGLPIFRRIRRK